jgi:hypothetical protein
MGKRVDVSCEDSQFWYLCRYLMAQNDLQTRIIPGSSLSAADWDAWVAASPQANVCALHGYATAMLPNWQVLLVEDGTGNRLAAMPLSISAKWGMKLAYTPFFAQSWGPMLGTHGLEGERRYAHERACLEALAQALRAYVTRAGVQAHPSLRYAAPFAWAGFRLETRYTWQLNLHQPEETLWQSMASAHQRQVKKAQKNGFAFRAIEPQHLADLAALNARSGHPIWSGGEATTAMFLRLAQWLVAEGKGGVFGVFSGDTLLAAVLFANAFGTRHYLAGAMHPDHRDSGAMTALLWNGICEARNSGFALFDCEGSMQPSIEVFFRKFGAAPVPYLQINRSLMQALPIVGRWA